MESFVKIHSFTSDAKTWFVNLFVVEGKEGVVLVDGAMTISFAEKVRHFIRDELKKPILAAVLTHGHPDHYSAVGEIIKGYDIPYYSLPGAKKQAMEREKEELEGMLRVFGDDYPKERIFPNTIISDGDSIEHGDIKMTVRDFGPGESDSDSAWTVETPDENKVVIGDLIYNHMHCFLLDGHPVDWLKSIELLKSNYHDGSTFHPSHGISCGREMLYWQESYLKMFINSAWEIFGDDRTMTDTKQQAILNRLKSFLPNDNLLFLAGFRIDETISKILDQTKNLGEN